MYVAATILTSGCRCWSRQSGYPPSLSVNGHTGSPDQYHFRIHAPQQASIFIRSFLTAMTGSRSATPAGFVEAFAERDRKSRVAIGRSAVDKPDPRHRRLLRPCRERPRSSRSGQARQSIPAVGCGLACGPRAGVRRGRYHLLISRATEGPSTFTSRVVTFVQDSIGDCLFDLADCSSDRGNVEKHGGAR